MMRDTAECGITIMDIPVAFPNLMLRTIRCKAFVYFVGKDVFFQKHSCQESIDG
jgi:hypothetical protein